jgi:hypothetical protein
MLIKAVQQVVWFVALIGWAVIGFFFWVPFLARVIAVYVVHLLVATLSESDLSRAEQGLDKGTRFYREGFERVNRLQQLSTSVREPGLSQLRAADFVAALIHTVYSIMFWTVLAQAIGAVDLFASWRTTKPAKGNTVAAQVSPIIGSWVGVSPTDVWPAIAFSETGTVKRRRNARAAPDSGRFTLRGDTATLVFVGRAGIDQTEVLFTVRADTLIAHVNGVLARFTRYTGGGG